MQLEPVETDTGRHLRRAHKLVADLVHVSARHFTRRLVLRAPSHGRGCEYRPISGRERCVALFPPELGRAFRSGMAKLDCDLGVSLGMDKFDYALPGVEVFRGVKACTSGRDAAFRRNAGHFRKHQPGAAFGSFGVVHEVPFVGCAVFSAILRHR